MDEVNITTKRLAEYLNDPDAPPGLVYFVYDRPIIQVDFFPREYTLFWLGSIRPSSFFVDSFDMFASIYVGNFGRRPSAFRYEYWPSTEGYISITRSQLTRRGVSLTREHQKLRYPRTRFGGDLLSLRERVRALRHTEDLAALQVDFNTMQRPVRSFSVWGDTDKSPKKEKEVGVTLDVSISASENLRPFLLKTSSALRELPAVTFDELFKLIVSATSERRYRR